MRERAREREREREREQFSMVGSNNLKLLKKWRKQNKTGHLDYFVRSILHIDQLHHILLLAAFLQAFLPTSCICFDWIAASKLFRKTSNILLWFPLASFSLFLSFSNIEQFSSRSDWFAFEKVKFNEVKTNKQKKVQMFFLVRVLLRGSIGKVGVQFWLLLTSLQPNLLREENISKRNCLTVMHWTTRRQERRREREGRRGSIRKGEGWFHYSVFLCSFPFFV